MSRDDTDLEVEAPDDLRSALLAAVAESEAAPASEDAPSDTPTRARGQDGKFAKVAEQPVETEKPEAPPVEAEKAQTPPEDAAKPETKGVEAPAYWTAADKEKFKKLPTEAQTLISERSKVMEADYTRKTQELADERRKYAPIKEIFAPHEAALQASGYTPETLVRAWAKVEEDLMSGKGIAVVKSIVEGYKLDKAAIVRELGLASSAAPGVATPPAPDGQPPAALPPELAAKLQSYDQFIAQQQQERQQAAVAQQREAESRVMSTIDQFRDAKDATGNLSHPHFATVEEQMTRLAIAARASGQPVPPLDELYDQAVWANPSTRTSVLEAKSAAEEAQRKAADAERAKEARAKAERAKKAASSVTGSPSLGQSGGRSGNGERSLREELEAAAEELASA